MAINVDNNDREMESEVDLEDIVVGEEGGGAFEVRNSLS